MSRIGRRIARGLSHFLRRGLSRLSRSETGTVAFRSADGVVRPVLRRLFGLDHSWGIGAQQVALGVIVIQAASVGKRCLSARIRLLAEELKTAGVRETICVLPPGANETLESLDGCRLVSATALQERLLRRDALFVPDDQYHLSHEWMSDLIGRTAGNGVSHCPGAEGSLLAGNLALKCRAAAVSRKQMHRFLPWVLGGNLLLGSSDAWRKAAGITVEEVPITPVNASTIYRQSCRTSWPISFVVETSARCNYSCYMCPYHGERQRNLPSYIPQDAIPDMPIELFKETVDQILELPRPFEEGVVVTISPFNRGEFLVYPHWREALRYIKARGARAYFSTNGSLWTEEDVRFVLDIGLDHLQFSIDGATSEGHARIRMNNDFPKVVNTLKQVMKGRVERGLSAPGVQLAYTLNERSIAEREEYLRYWLNKADGLLLGPENYVEAENQNTRYKTEFSPVAPRPKDFRAPCSTLRDCAWILADGTTPLCIGSKRVVLGNRREKSVAELLQSGLRREVIDYHSAASYDNPVCRNCQFWYHAYMERVETDDYVLHVSSDTQYYSRKQELERWWE